MRKSLFLLVLLVATTAHAQISNSTVTCQQPVASKLKTEVSGTITCTPSGTQTVSGTVAATQSGTWDIEDITGTISLPTGASTEATLSTLNGKVTIVDTGNVTVSSSALPTGASTSALQTSGNASLTSIDGKIVTVDTGAVVVSSSALPTGASTEATLSTLNGKVTAVDTGNVTVSSSALPTGASTLAEQQTQTTSLQLIDDAIQTEDTVVGSGDKGTGVLYRVIPKDGTAATLASVDDYSHGAVDVNGRHVVIGPADRGTASALSYAPFLIGGDATSNGIRTPVSDAQVITQLFDIIGRSITSPYANSENYRTGVSAADITDTSSHEIISANLGFRTYVASWGIANTDTLVGTRCDLLNGAVVFDSLTVGPIGADPTESRTHPVPLRGEVNTAWNVQCATTSAEVRANVTGFIWIN